MVGNACVPPDRLNAATTQPAVVINWRSSVQVIYSHSTVAVFWQQFIADYFAAPQNNCFGKQISALVMRVEKLLEAASQP
jgi:hypothetical protein